MAPRGGPADGLTALDVALDARVDHGTTVEVELGGAVVPARVGWLGGRFHQLRCAAAVAAARGDALVVRAGGRRVAGVVLDPAAARHGPKNDVLIRLARLERGLEVGGTQDVAPPLDAAALALEARYRAAGADPPRDAELDADGRAALFALREAGRVVRLERGRHIHVDVTG